MKNIAKKKLKYELETLENIISKDLATFIENNFELTEQLITDFQAELNHETEIIKENLRHATFCFATDQELTRHIQFHQQALISLAGNLLQYVSPIHLNSVPVQNTTDVFSHIVYNALENLLTFIELHFSKYFDQTAWIPANYRLIVSHHITTNIDGLKMDLGALGVEPSLIQIVFQPYQALVEANNQLTYHEVIYLKRLKNNLSELTIQPQQNITTALAALLHSLNFNTPQYINYCIAFIKNDYYKEVSHANRIHTLAKYRKLIIQTDVTPGIAMHPNRASVAEKLRECIDAEIWYLSHSKPETLPVPQASPAATNAGVQPLRNKIAVTLNLTQLTYFFRLLIAVGVIPNRNKSALTEFISQTFQTSKDTVSEDSIRKKLYQAEASTKRVIKALLLKMIAYLETDEGGSIV